MYRAQMTGGQTKHGKHCLAYHFGMYNMLCTGVKSKHNVKQDKWVASDRGLTSHAQRKH